MRRLTLLAVVALATAAAAAPHHDFGPLADLLAGVLVVREGGVSAAMDAMPGLHDTTHAYIRTLAVINDNANTSKWTGWSDATAAKRAALSNATVAKLATLPNKTAWWPNYTDPLTAKGKDVERAFYTKVNPVATKDLDADKAWTEWKAKMDKIVPDSAANDAAIAALNAKLAPFNIEVSAKMVMPPSKFENAAAVIAKHFAGIMLEETAVDFSPCLVSIHTGVAMADGTLVNIAPEAVRVMTNGAMLWPQGVNLQPALLFVSPMGANVQPQGVQIAPYLMAVSPMGANVSPAGAVVAPVDKMVMPVGKQINPVGKSFAPMEHMDMPVQNDITPGGAPHLHHSMHGDGDGSAVTHDAASHATRRRLLSSADADRKLTIVDDPLDLSHEFPTDYRNWASLLSNIMLTVSGGAAASPDGAAAVDALSQLTLAVRSRLAAAADGEPLLPRFHLSEPMLQAAMGGMNGMPMNGMPMMDSGSMGSMHMHEDGKGMLTKLMTSKTFFKFAPCVLHEMKTGASASLTGLRFAPALVSVMTNLLEARFDGININPMLLYVQSMGANVQPQGLDVQPALLYVGPMGASVQPQGLNVEPKGLAMMPMGVNIAPQGSVVAPVRDMRMPTGTLFAPIKNDITPHTGHDMAGMVGHDMGSMQDGAAIAAVGGDAHAGHHAAAPAPAPVGHQH